MRPITPVVNGLSDLEVVFAKDQSEYIPLPALKLADPQGTVITRWRLTWRERLTVLLWGDVWLSLLTFHDPLQPVRLQVDEPRVECRRPRPRAPRPAFTTPDGTKVPQ